MSSRTAVLRDAGGDVIGALAAYEDLMARGAIEAEEFLNYMVLAFMMTDYGFVRFHRLGIDSTELGFQHLERSIEYGYSRFASDPCSRFWTRYIEEMLNPQNELSEKEASEFIREGCLDATICKPDLEEARSKLRLRYSGQTTARATYILSLLCT